MKGLASALALALLASGGGRGQPQQGDAPINFEPGAPPPPTVETQGRRPEPDPDCAPPREGKYWTHGNRWGRYGHICIDHVEISFEAFPDPSVSYSIHSDRCPDLGRSSRFNPPENLFEAPVPEQIGIFKSAVADDLGEFARQCGIRLDSAPFVDERFDRFYADYGDGWWFDRLKGRFHLTPNVTSDGRATGAR